MSIGTILVLIGIICIFLSAFPGIAIPSKERPVSLWNLGWAFVLSGIFLVGGVRPL
jgi:hypothetical protein